jgi:hypothetical protein
LSAFVALVVAVHIFVSSFEPDVGQDSDEERVLRKKNLQVSCPAGIELEICKNGFVFEH